MTMDDNKLTFDKITSDLTHHIRINKGFLVWMGFLTVSLVALGEFGIAALADTIETARHLLMFHYLTDVTVWLFVIECAHMAGGNAQCHLLFPEPFQHLGFGGGE